MNRPPASRFDPPHRLHLKNGAASGFTLVEVAVTVFILATAIATSITALQSAFRSLDSARNLEIAGQIMQCEFEKERLFNWTQLNEPAYQPVIDTSFTRNPTIAGRFTLSRALAVLPQRSGQMVQVTLTTSWRSYDGHNLSRSYTTYFAQNGLQGYFYDH
ncbi:MAG: hypothetical protein HZA31_12845 [Opitutae bacterium]|nr:hypothetical protein [Opitutae bacterium]